MGAAGCGRRVPLRRREGGLLLPLRCGELLQLGVLFKLRQWLLLHGGQREQSEVSRWYLRRGVVAGDFGVLWQLQRGLLLLFAVDDCNRRRCLPDRGVQHRGWDYLNDLGVHALPRGHVRLCHYADNRGLLGHVYCGVLLPRGLRVRQRCDQRCRMHQFAQGVPDRGVQHRGWDYFNDIRLHALPRGHVRLGYDADDRGLLGHVYCGILLPRGLRVRQRRDQRGRVQHLAQDVQRGILLPR